MRDARREQLRRGLTQALIRRVNRQPALVCNPQPSKRRFPELVIICKVCLVRVRKRQPRPAHLVLDFLVLVVKFPADLPPLLVGPLKAPVNAFL